MKKLLYIFLFFSSSLLAQNLVPNPSFEQYDTCPDNLTQVYRATGWTININTADYFNGCSANPNISTPSNAFGFQYPPDNLCKAYCGLYTYIQGGNIREYLGAQLLSQLQIGQKYYISLKISLAINPTNGPNCATNNMGILFTNTFYGDTMIFPPSVVNNFAHFKDTTVITDTTNWTTISGSFIADSAYNYFMIGNFFNDVNTDTVKFNTMNCLSVCRQDKVRNKGA